MKNNAKIKKMIETFSEARTRNEHKVKAFSTNSDDKVLIDMRDRIKSCKKGGRCNLLACSVCMRKFRLKYLTENLPIWEDLLDKCPVYHITTIIHIPVNLKADSLTDLRKWFFKNLKQYGFEKLPLIGGVDFSYNTEKGSSFYCQHLHFVVATYNKESFIGCLKKSFFKRGNVARPIQCLQIRDKANLAKVLNYTIPAFFEKRSRYLVNKNHYTKHYPLANKQLCELYKFLSKNEPLDLLIFNLDYGSKEVSR